MLHDIGRFVEYEQGLPHPLESSKLAKEILIDCKFEEEEIRWILEAIREHGNSERKEEVSLNGIIYRADKLSRECYFCTAEHMCHWKEEKKNHTLKI